MDFVSLIVNNASLVIIDERTNFKKWTQLAIKQVNILTPTDTSINPAAATGMQIVSVSDGSALTNMQALKVIQPAHMNIECVCNDQSTFDSLVAGWGDLESTYSITSRSIIASGMALTTIDFEQTSENLSGMKLILTFEQTSFSQDSTFNPKQTADQSTLGISNKDPEGLTSTVSSFYNTIKSKLGSLI